MIKFYSLLISFFLFSSPLFAQEMMNVSNATQPATDSMKAEETPTAASPMEAIAIENLLKFSNAAEMFAKAHDGQFPTASDDFTIINQYDVNTGLCRGTDGYYRYRCVWREDTYEVKAISVDANLRDFVITVGGVLKILPK